MPAAQRIATASAEETAAVGRAIGGVLAAGDLVLLRGDIGAGKTTLVKGIAAALGVGETVVSPTFMLHCVYDGRLVLNHFDFYRLDDAVETLVLGLDEALDAGGVAVVEWADRVPEAVREPFLDVEIELPDASDDRVVVLTAAGGTWTGRLERIERRLP